MKRLGQFLIELGWINQDDLARALQSQEVLGGRLGTCLLELGVLSEGLLLKALSHQLGVDPTRPRDLRNIPPEVHALLPAKAAVRCHAVPFRMLGGELYVAMIDARNLAFQDEIAFATGKSVRPHVAHEARLFEALSEYYGVESPARYLQLLRRLDEEEQSAEPELEDRLPGVVGDSDPPASIGLTAPLALLDSVEPDTDERRSGGRVTKPAARLVMPEAKLPQETGPPPSPVVEAATAQTPVPRTAALPAESEEAAQDAPAGGQDFETEPRDLRVAQREDPVAGGNGFRLLGGEMEPNAIASRVLDHLEEQFETVALFMVRRDQVCGWMGQGEHLDESMLKTLRIGFDEPSLFLNLREGGLFFAGPMPPMAAHLEVAKCWGGELPRQCLMLPIRIRDRLVSSIICIPGGHGLAEIDLDGMNQLAREMGSALESSIVRSKRLNN